MNRVLITGAAGFVGRHCIPLLAARGYDVHATTSRAAGTDIPGAHWHAVDLLDEAATAALLAALKPTHLLHLAWCTAHGAFWASSENLMWVRASLALVQQFRAAGGRRLVGAGTCAEYDWRYGLCAEDRTPLAPATLYGASKHAFHTIVERYAREQSLSEAWTRLFLLYGPFEHRGRLVPSVVRSLAAGEPALCTHGQQIRDLLHAADAADALVTLLDSEAQGAYNVASGTATRLSEVIMHVASRLRRPELVRLGAVPAKDEPAVLLADVSRIRDEVGWKPRYTLTEGLDQAIDWWTRGAQVWER